MTVCKTEQQTVNWALKGKIGAQAQHRDNMEGKQRTRRQRLIMFGNVW